MKLDLTKSYGKIVGKYAEYPDARICQGGHFYLNRGGDCICCDDGDPDIEPIEVDVPPITNDTPKVEPDHISPEEAIDTITNQANPEMLLTDQELSDIADQGMGPLRAYAAPFGIKGTSKMEIVNELKAMR